MSLLNDLLKDLESLDDDFHAEVDALANDPNWHSPFTPTRDSSRPFGIDLSSTDPTKPRSDVLVQSELATHPVVPRAPAKHIFNTRMTSLAATLIVGLALGWLLFGRGTPDGGVHILAATAAVSFAPPRGDEIIPQIDIQSPIDGFVTVIALAPGRRQQVVPVSGGADISVSKGAKSEPIELREGTTNVVFAITPTPAAEAIRRMLNEPDARRYSPENAQELVTDVRQILEQKGHRRIALGIVAIDETP